MSSNSTLFDRIFASAQAQLPGFIARVLDTGVMRLAFHAVLAGDQRSAADIRTAGATLHKLRRHIAPAFLGEMARALEGDIDPALAGAPIDICLDDDLPRRLDGEHLRNAAELACRSERVRFDALFSTAAGQLVVDGQHALRPEVHAQALAAALQEFPVRHAIRSAWFAFLGEALGHELESFYAALSKELANAGAREAEFIVPSVGGRPFERWAGFTTPLAANLR
jgi:hypothetical protein